MRLGSHRKGSHGEGCANTTDLLQACCSGLLQLSPLNPFKGKTMMLLEIIIRLPQERECSANTSKTDHYHWMRFHFQLLKRPASLKKSFNARLSWRQTWGPRKDVIVRLPPE